jgi:hypothetical protein
MHDRCGLSVDSLHTISGGDPQVHLEKGYTSDDVTLALPRYSEEQAEFGLSSI